MSVDGSATGGIDFSGDRDWFAVTLEAGRTYRVDLEGTWTGNGAAGHRSLVLRGIHDADGVLIAGTTDDSGEGPNRRVEFEAAEGGTYYVAVGGRHWLGGDYTVSVTEVSSSPPPPSPPPPLDDYTAGTETTGAVVVGGSATGEVEASGDRDWFAVTLEAGKAYRINLKGTWTGSGTLSDPYLHGVHDANGFLIAGTTDDNDGSGSNSRVTFTAEESGTYYVAAGAAGNGTGTYTLAVREVPDDFAAGTETSGLVSVGGSASGKIEAPGDRDWFAVTLEAGKAYRIDLEGWWTGSGTLRDPYLRGVHDASGVLLAGTEDDADGEGFNSRVWFNAKESGTYYVAAGSGDLSGGNSLVGDTGTYTLSVTEVPDDFGAWTGTSGLVSVGGSATGEIEFSGDRDWFAVTLEAGKTYRFDLKGFWTGDGTLFAPWLYGIHDANGVLAAGAWEDDGVDDEFSRVWFTAGESGTYYVAARGTDYAAAGGTDPQDTGTYTLSVTEVEDDYAAGTETTGAVSVGGSATGEVDAPDDRDWFEVMLEAGTTYRIDLKGSPTGSGTLGDPYLRGVHDAGGARIAGTTNDDGGQGSNSRVTFTPEEAGAYYVAAGGYKDDYGSSVGTYTLSVEEVM